MADKKKRKWFIVYVLRGTASTFVQVIPINNYRNAIINEHPIEWLAKQKEKISNDWNPVLIFYNEITAEKLSQKAKKRIY